MKKSVIPNPKSTMGKSEIRHPKSAMRIGSVFLFLWIILSLGISSAGAVNVTFKTYKDETLKNPRSAFSPGDFFWVSVEVDQIDSPLILVHLNAIEFTRVAKVEDSPDDVAVLEAKEGKKGPFMSVEGTVAETYIDNIPTWKDTGYVNIQVMEPKGDVGVTGGPGSVAIVKFQVMSGASPTATIGLTAEPHNKIPTHGGSTYTILFINTEGTSIPVDSLTPVTIKITSPPMPPTNLSASTVSSSQIRLNWEDKSHNETNFVIERKTVGGTYTEVKTVGENVKTWVDDVGLSPNTTYCYQVKACNDVGCSTYSNESCTETKDVPPNCALLRLTATPRSTSRIDLAWNDLDNETGYVIEAKTAVTSFSKIADLPSDSIFYPHTGLPHKTTVFYRITASNSVGKCYSDVVEATTCDYIPAAPSGLMFTSVTADRVDLEWTDNSDNESGFEVERKTDAQPYTRIGTVGKGITNYIDNDPALQPKTHYDYRVRACNNNSSACDDYKCSNYASADVNTLDAPPRAPGGLGTTANSSSQIALNWTDNSNNETGFKIERRKDSKTGPIETIINVPSTTEKQINMLVQFTDTGLSPKTTYYYQVLAYNSIGNSGYSNTASATTDDVPPKDPQNLKAVAVSDSQINLSWTDKSDNEEGFIIEWSAASATGPFAEVKVDTDTITYAHTRLTPATTYYYQVKAYNSWGNSGYSVANATTPDTIPAAPSNLIISETGIYQLRLNWEDNANNETGFRIERKTTGGYVQIAETPTPNTTYLDTGLNPKTTYTYRVRAYNSAGNSDYYSNEVTGTTLPSHYTLTVNSDYGSPSPPVGPGSHASGASVTASVKSPVSGPSRTRYVCTGWTGTGSVPDKGTTNTVTFNITKDSTIIWQWRVEYQLLTAVNNPDCGGISPVSGEWHEENTWVQIKATSTKSGCDFLSWGGDLAGSTDNPTLVRMDGPKSIVAYFGEVQCMLRVNSDHGSPSLSAGSHFYSCNTPLTLSCPSSPVNGTPGVRYVLTGWTGTGSVPSSGAVSNCPASFTLTQDSSITWNWKTEYYLTTSVKPAGGGSISVTPSSASGWYEKEKSVTLTATPESSFSGWTGDLVGDTNPTSLTMNGPRSVIANFSGCNTCHEADNNPCDCKIGDGELLLYINRWVAAEVTDGSLLTAINIWVAGSCDNWKPGSCLAPSPAPVFSPPLFKSPKRAPIFNGDKSSGPQSAPSNSQVTVTRTLDCSGDPTIEVTLTVEVDESNKPSGVIIREYIPSNWTVISSDPNYVGNPATGEIKWLLSDLTLPVKDQTITYQVQISGGDKTFRGELVYTDPNENVITKDIDGDVQCGGDGYIQCKDTFQVTVARTLDCSGDPTVEVSLAVDVDESNKPSGVIIREYIPSNWTVISSDPKYVGDDPTTGEIKWLLSDLTLPVKDQTITYQVQISGGNKTFRGEVVYIDPNEKEITVDICGYIFCLNSRALTVISTYGSPSPDSGTHSYPAGTSVTASVTSPVSGPEGTRYICTGWRGTGSVPKNGSDTSVTFTITDDSTLTWNWKTEYYLTTSVDPIGGGTISPSPGWYESGQSPTLTATPEAGCSFTGWSGDLSGTTTPVTLFMDAPKSVTADFNCPVNQPPVAKAGPDQTDIGIGKTVGLDGSLSSDPDGDPITYHWTQTGGPTVTLSNYTAPKPTFTPLTTGEYRFQLVVNDGRLDSPPDEVIITVKYTLTVSSAYGAPSPGDGTHYYSPGALITASVTSPVSGGKGVRYVCTGWTGTGSVPVSGGGTTVDFTINQNSTITWGWKPEYQLTTSVNPPGAGTISISPEREGKWYQDRVVLTLKADPADTFAQWSGDLSTSTNPTFLTMDGPKTITANFATEFITASINAPAEVTYESTFTATVNINQISSLDHGNIQLDFDSTLFKLLSLDKGSLISGASSSSSLSGAWFFFDLSGGSGISGAGTLMEAKFKAIGPPSSVGKISISDISLGNTAGQAIEVDFVIGAEVKIGYPLCEPVSPTNLSLTVISLTKIDLNWSDNSNNEAGFEIQRKTAGGEYSRLARVSNDDTSYSDQSVSEGITYCYQVRAYNNCGYSGRSNEECALTTDKAPLPPAGLKATAVSGDRINLAWDDNSANEWGFKIERSLTGGGRGFSEIGRVPANVTVYHDKGLISRTTYFYRVKAWNNIDDSPYSTEAKDTTLGATVLKVNAPGTVAPQAGFGAVVEVTQVDDLTLAIFQTNFDPTVLRLISIEAGNLISSSNPTINSNNSSGRSSLLINIPAGVSGSGGLVKFNFEAIGAPGDFSRIELDNITLADGAGNNIPVDSVLPAQVTISGSCPASPTNLRVTGSGQNSLTLSWQDNSNNETGFLLERKTASTDYSQAANLGANSATYTDRGLSLNTQYYYRVKAYNDLCESGYYEVATTCCGPLPDQPTQLTVGRVSGIQAELEWKDNSNNETGFKIERMASGGSYSEAGIVPVNVTRYRDDGLNPCISYSYRVKAYNKIGESDYSNEAVLPASTQAPAPPSGLTGEVISSAQINFSWHDKADNAFGYKIERSVNGAGFTQIRIVGANVTAYSDAGLSPETTYCYRVRAYNECGDSNYTNQMCLTTPEVIAGPPLPPYNLSALPISESEIKLSWQSRPGDDKIGFIIERRKLNETTFAELTRVAANKTGVTDNFGLEPETTYCYQIKAYNNYGESDPSNEACAITPGPLAPPDNLSAEAVSSSQIRLNWRNNSTNETGFKIERRKKGSNIWNQIGTASAKATTYLDSGLESETTYYYQVRAYEGDRHSGYSKEASATTPGSPPAAPDNLRGQEVLHNRIKITWRNNSTNESGFKIEKRTGAAGSFNPIGTVGAGVSTYQDTDVNPETLYYYRVRAYNQWEDSAYSNTVSLQTPPPPPVPPSNLTAKVVSSSRIDLSWQDNSENEDGFKIERSVDLPDNWVQINKVEAGVNQYHDIEVTHSTTYYYRVRAGSDKTGDSEYSNIASATTSPLTEISSVKLAFASDRTGNYEVYLMDDKGGAVTPLTDAPEAQDWQPAISPDGTKVVFVSDREGNYDLYLIGAGGTGLTRLTGDPAEDIEPAFSPDGTQIVFSSNRDGDYEIYLLEVNDPGPPVQLTQNTAQDHSPSFSPDGTRIVFVSNRDGNNEIYTMDVKGNVGSQLTTTNYPVDNSQPCFSPDGTRITFSSNQSGNDEIYVMDSNGKNLKDITNHSSTDMNPSFSPNRNLIAFTSDRGGNHEIYLINIALGGEPKNLTNYPARDIHPSFGLAGSPLAPANLSIRKVGDSQVELKWQDRSIDEQEFVIERRTDGEAYSKRDAVGPRVATYLDSVTPKIDYCYQVRARNEYGSSEPSNEVCLSDCCLAPNPPTALLAQIGGGPQIKLTWTDNSDNESHFKIERSRNGNDYYSLSLVEANATTYDDSDFDPGSDYYYQVRAVNAQGESDPSNEAFAKVALSPPTNLTGKRLSDTQVKLTWQDNSEDPEEDGFSIERKTEGGEYAELAAVGRDETTYQDTSLDAEKAYYYRVRAYDNLGRRSKHSNEIKVPFLSEALSGSNGLIVYPNPFFNREHSQINFEGNISVGDKIWIYTSAGELAQTLPIDTLQDNDVDRQKVFTWDNPTNKNGDRLASGIYIYILKGAGSKAIGKFAVVH